MKVILYKNKNYVILPAQWINFDMEKASDPTYIMRNSILDLYGKKKCRITFKSGIPLCI